MLVFQHGIGASIFGFQTIDVVEAWVPLFLFSVLFGLSMDYQVFLFSRIHDALRPNPRHRRGRAVLGTLLTAGFVLQVMPPLWTAHRTDHPTGLSPGTWSLILGELSCWAVFGVHRANPILMVLGFTGVTVSSLILLRIKRTASMRDRGYHIPAATVRPAAPGTNVQAGRSRVVDAGRIDD